MSAINYNAVSFKTVLVWSFGLLLVGLSSLVLLSFYDFITLYAAALSSAFLVAFRVLLFFFVAYIGLMLFLSFEHKAIQNERFKNDNVQLLPRVPASAVDDKELDILRAYSQLVESGEFSLNRLSLAVFGKKGGSYNAQIKQVLLDNDIDF